METRLTYYGNVVNGQLQKNTFEKMVSEFGCFNNQRVEITIQKLKSSRSIMQNRLWWLYVTILANELGYSKDEMHEICKFKLLKKEKIDEKTGELFQYIGSTATLGKGEFVDLVDSLIRWSAETFNIVLPLPNTQTEIF